MVVVVAVVVVCVCVGVDVVVSGKDVAEDAHEEKKGVRGVCCLCCLLHPCAQEQRRHCRCS